MDDIKVVYKARVLMESEASLKLSCICHCTVAWAPLDLASLYLESTPQDKMSQMLQKLILPLIRSCFL